MPLPLPLRRPLVSSILPPLSCPQRSSVASKSWHLSCLSFSRLRSSPSFPLLSLARSAPRFFEHSALLSSTSPYATAVPPSNEESDRAKLAQVSKRLENTSRYFKRLGSLGFWGQLVCTIVAAVILSFSVVITGKITSPATFYAAAGGIAAAFVSVFWSFGYIRLAERLQRSASEPAKVTGSSHRNNLSAYRGKAVYVKPSPDSAMAVALCIGMPYIYSWLQPTLSFHISWGLFSHWNSYARLLYHIQKLFLSPELREPVSGLTKFLGGY